MVQPLSPRSHTHQLGSPLSRFRGKVIASSASKLKRPQSRDFSAPNFTRDVYYTRDVEKVVCECERTRLIPARVIPPLPLPRPLREGGEHFLFFLDHQHKLTISSISIITIFSPPHPSSPSPLSTGSGFRRGKMYDCMEAFAVTPRQLYDVTNRSACMLRKSSISPFSLGLDPFGWPQPASLQCRWTCRRSTLSAGRYGVGWGGGMNCGNGFVF